MKALDWNRLTEITKNVKPYRNSSNRYPVADRRHNTKCFYVKEIDGEIVYEITYGYKYLEHFHTKEEYLEDKKKAKPIISCRDWETDESRKYCTYTTTPNVLGVVRSDNTFEFTGKYYGQGHNSVISQWSRGCFFNSSRHGGFVYYDRSMDIFHPIFKGMRLHIDTMMPHESSIYQVTGKRVSRKDAKQFLKKYEDFYKINEVMFKTIDMKIVLDTTIDVIHSLAEKDEVENYYFSQTSTKRMIEWADNNINIAPLDSALAYALAYDISRLGYITRAYINSMKYGRNTGYQIEPISLYGNLKRRLNKELYRRHNEVMKPIEHTMGKMYPPSEWGLTITVNGKEVEQY